jgi:2-keto-4-pentenoate hydratase/2-oxohepta-3-ene-1,7-dioic acid hydratase in catechol pathway
MRFARFLSNDTARCGLIIEGDWLRPLPARITSLQTYLALPESERDALPTEDPVEMRNTTLLAPVRPEKNVFCVGRNYMGHAEEVARAIGKPLNLPNVPTFFTKAPTAILDPGATIHLSPDVSSEYDWEAELAVVIGRRCRDVSEADALAIYNANTSSGSKGRASMRRARSVRGS